jgi:hypothetical protein
VHRFSHGAPTWATALGAPTQSRPPDGTLFLPDGLSLADELPFLAPAEHRFLSQVQGRTYANMFVLVERFLGAKMLDVSRDDWLSDQTALEAIVRFTDEELKHQELLRRLEVLAGAHMLVG